MALGQLKQEALAVADAMKAAGGSSETIANTGGGSRHRGLPEDLRARFIAVRAELFDRGVYHPVLVRFDSATVPQAPTSEIADELATLAAALTPDEP
ncbi:MAG TPA: hypothetical protein VEK79_11370 [Thermoanaerobaculia bacterium]|nr:hypothetical protein [Thermoanaerobaculia bacterium]